MKDHRNLIEKALTHVREKQSPDGSFEHLSGFSPDDFVAAIPRRTTFFTANIMACLRSVPGRTSDIQNAGARFLLSQKSERWSFNYWACDAENRAGTPYPYPPYPDDLDDTFAALTAFALHDPATIDGCVSSAIAKLLTAQEVTPGGPYRTWLVARDMPTQWADIDPVVNSTIAYFLSLIGVHLPGLATFIDSAALEGRLVSPYYPGTIPVCYFLARYHKASSIRKSPDARKKLMDLIVNDLESAGKNTNTLELAMAVTSLANLADPDGQGNEIAIITESADLLAARVEHEGFEPYGFCIDPARDGKRCYAGASALTAAFCAEAFAHARAPRAPGGRQTPTIHDHIRMLARAACHRAGASLHKAAITRIDRVSDERITALAYEFRHALYEHGKIIPLDITEQLSLANLYGWIAYDIYDDALDGDNDDGRSMIPCANFFLRELTHIYIGLESRIPGIKALFEGTMDAIDDANAWEQEYCRVPMLPDFGDHRTLADRSIGHAMGPLAELLIAGYSPASTEYQSIASFFRHYLIARQLHDDAHDWVDDLRRGRVNSVAAIILRDTTTDSPPSALQKLFWTKTIEEVVALITSHVASARRARDRAAILDGADFMESALRKLEFGARRAIKERDEVLVFLNDYKTSPPAGAAF